MWTPQFFRSLCQPPIIGMVHLQPLPGSPLWAGDFHKVVGAALADAENLVAGGVGALMVENYHDVPFYPDMVPPATVAAMTWVVGAIVGEFPDVPLGVNVLRNDAEAALAVAMATGAAFIRINVHVGAAVTDQGSLAGKAYRTLRLRRELGCDIGILADVRVKHARPLVSRPLAEEARDLRLRGLADGIIITGAATGSGAAVADVQEVREALPDCPLLVGSGIRTANLAEFLPVADGVIVGTSLKAAGDGEYQPVSRERTCELVTEWNRAAGNRGVES